MCRCGGVVRAFPVLPTVPITCPRLTDAPGAMPSAIASRWALYQRLPSAVS
jgi:hypothetical protein